MNAFEAGYQDGLYRGVESNQYTQAEHRFAYRRGYDRGVFEYCCLVETQDQSRDEYEEN